MNNSPKNNDCPALMNDGRFLTDYRPNSDVNDLFIKQNGLANSYDYRQFMINNAKAIMDLNRRYSLQMGSCNSCNYYQVDPNGNESYWAKYAKWLGYK